MLKSGVGGQLMLKSGIPPPFLHLGVIVAVSQILSKWSKGSFESILDHFIIPFLQGKNDVPDHRNCEENCRQKAKCLKHTPKK